MILEVKELRVFYRRVEGLHRASLRVDEGAIVTVIGPNGAGKSTLLGAVMGLLRCTGEVRFKGVGLVKTLRRDDASQTWIGRGVVRESTLKGAPVNALLQFQAKFGAAWSHSEGGVLFLRAPMTDRAEGERLAHQMRGYFAEHKVEAQVDLQEIGVHDYSVWDELVQYSLGLRT